MYLAGTRRRSTITPCWPYLRIVKPTSMVVGSVALVVGGWPGGGAFSTREVSLKHGRGIC